MFPTPWISEVESFEANDTSNSFQILQLQHKVMKLAKCIKASYEDEIHNIEGQIRGITTKDNQRVARSIQYSSPIVQHNTWKTAVFQAIQHTI